MALTVLIQLGDDGEPLSVSFDSPRIVIGRSKNCELILPDPTISARHATIRREGAGNLIIDEGSMNGVLVGNVKLPPQTPRPVADGELVRVGRVWLELCFGGGMPSPRGHAEAVALEMLRRQMAAAGDDISPKVAVVAGPDVGAELELTSLDHEYVFGRARDVDMVLSDEMASRRHVSVQHEGGRWMLRELGSKRGSELAGEELSGELTPWRHGAELCFGNNTFALTSPLADAFDEALATAEVRMRPEEYDVPPPGQEPEPVVEAPSEEVVHDAPPTPTPPETSPATVEPRGARYATVDMAVVLVALALLGLSITGLWWVLG